MRVGWCVDSLDCINMAVNSQVSLEQQEQVLESNRDFIVKRLDADDLIDELIQVNLIGQNSAQRVQLIGTSRIEKNRIIFDQLITCGPGALEKFCEILRRKKRQLFIAERLEKCEYEHQCVYVTRWGSIFHRPDRTKSTHYFTERTGPWMM